MRTMLTVPDLPFASFHNAELSSQVTYPHSLKETSQFCLILYTTDKGVSSI